MSQPILSFDNININVGTKPVIDQLVLSVHPGEVHAIMGPNGSGKSTLAHAVAGHPAYTIQEGDLLFEGQSIRDWSADKRARAGIFLAFQQPPSIPGLSLFTFLHEAHAAVTGQRISVIDFEQRLRQIMAELSIDPAFAYRDLNDGFSGGEKKRFELLQMILLEPKLVILDEIDSGLDIDALKLVANGIKHAQQKNPQLALVVITHYQRILKYLTPDYVHILCKGRIVRSGDATLVDELEKQGYDEYR